MIPNFGLRHLMDVYSLSESDDGFGGIATSDTLVYSDLPCRISWMTNEDEQELFGDVSANRIRVLIGSDYTVVRSHILVLSKNSPPAPINLSERFRVLFVKKQVDHTGNIHHSSIIAEYEDVDT